MPSAYANIITKLILISNSLSVSSRVGAAVKQAVLAVHNCLYGTEGTVVRIGLGQLENLMNKVLDGEAEEETLDVIEKTAEGIFASADCAIGSEAARMVLKGIKGFRDEYESHVKYGKCGGSHHQAVPCISLCPAHVDIPGYIALIHDGRYEDAVNLIRKDNPFPAACGMICEHPCEADCRRNMVDDAINIRGLKLQRQSLQERR